MGISPHRKITLKEIREDSQVRVYLEKADEHMAAIGYTEHGVRHALLVAETAASILLELGHPEREIELASIAGYLHDIGNVIGRGEHGHVSALIAQRVLGEIGMEHIEIADVMGAIGNHEETGGDPVNFIAAALILADKSDVNRSRVRNPKEIKFDIHDRVNYAAISSALKADKEKRLIALELTIDTEISHIMEYFEIFLPRMSMCCKAAEHLKCKFRLVINGTRLL
ncbi:TPA: phosphohydrolase [bacterium]|nr:phosphohydrolase [bacterium]